MIEDMVVEKILAITENIEMMIVDHIIHVDDIGNLIMIMMKDHIVSIEYTHQIIPDKD